MNDFLETAYPSKYWPEKYDWYLKPRIIFNWLMKFVLIFDMEKFEKLRFQKMIQDLFHVSFQDFFSGTQWLMSILFAFIMICLVYTYKFHMSTINVSITQENHELLLPSTQFLHFLCLILCLDFKKLMKLQRIHFFEVWCLL